MGYSGPYDRKIAEVDRIADVLTGKTEVDNPTGNRLCDSLERIADYLEKNKPASCGNAESMEASVASTVEGVVTDLNTLITKLKNVGVIAPEEFTMAFADVNDSVAGHADRQYNTDKISSVEEEDGVITITLSDKVANLKNFDAKNGWGVHKWLGIGIGVGINPITGLKYNGSALTADDILEATYCGLSAGYFVRWVAADLVLREDNTQKSKDTFTLWADGYGDNVYRLKIVEA